MKVYLTPVRPAGEQEVIEYVFGKDKIKAKKGLDVVMYNFSDLPNGRMKSIESTLDVIQSAERIDGVLWVKIKKYVHADATHEERYPEWQEYERLSDEKINDGGEVAKIEWKTQEEIDAEIAEAERLASIPSEVEQLKAKLKASTDHTDFLEEVIVEMAQVVYAGD